MKINDQATEKVQGFITKLNRSDFLQSMMAGMMGALPATIIGAFATLLNSISIPVYQSFLQSTGISALLNLAVICTTNIIALIICMSIAMNYAERKGVKHPAPVAFIALVAFLILTPLNLGTNDWGQATASIPMDWLGSQGMFSGIVVGVLVASIYAFVEKKHWTIKMPDSVPPMISEGFAALVPGIIIGIVFLALKALFGATPFGSFHACIYSILQAPLTGLTSNIWSLSLATIITGILWFFGIHGGAVVLSIIMPPLMALDMANMSAVAAGSAAPNGMGLAFYNICTMAGGYIGLQICMMFCKSERFKTLSKITLLPAVCGISEPLIFGAPCVMNTTFAIPFIFGQTITLICGYILNLIGVLPNLPGISAPMGTPFLIRSFISGGWRYVLYEIAMLVLLTFIWMPFVKKADKEALAAEQADTTEESN
jgi:PTS system, lactose/cellobiose family IIC component